MLLLEYSPELSLGPVCTVSLRATADRCRVIVWKLRSSTSLASMLSLLRQTTRPRTSSLWRTRKLPCCRAVKDKTTSCGRRQQRQVSLHLHCQYKIHTACYLALPSSHGASGGLGREMGNLAEVKVDRQLRAEVVQHTQHIHSLSCHTGQEIKSLRTCHQRHRQPRAGYCQLHTAATYKQRIKDLHEI